MSYKAENLPEDKQCFFGREGGVSQGLYASLNTNLKSRDNPQSVRRNLDIVAANFGLSYQNMLTLQQGVSAQAVWIDEASQFKIMADGAATDKQGVLLCLKTADCAPVLLADYKHGVIGVAHAGWRGAYKGIVENVATLMLEKGADKRDISAAVGPCIQQTSFEVGMDMLAEVCGAVPESRKFFTAGKDERHFQFDLSGFVVDKLRCFGIEDVVNSNVDTYPEKNGYFSFRRNTKQGLIKVAFDYPTQYSCIML